VLQVLELRELDGMQLIRCANFNFELPVAAEPGSTSFPGSKVCRLSRICKLFIEILGRGLANARGHCYSRQRK
jgi:hypothetical protein